MEKKKGGRKMKKVEIIGAAIVDVLVSPAEERVFRTGSYPAERILMTHGGDGLNEATVLHRLGAPVRLETVVGDDAAGQSVLRRMEALGMDCGGVQVREGLRTSVNVVLVKPDGQRCFLTDPRASQRQLRLEDIPMPFPQDVGILCFASIFVFPLMKTAQMQAVFAQAKAQGITVCADMTKCKNGERAEDIAAALRYVDYLFPNDAEAMLVTGADTVEDAAQVLLEAGTGTVVIKCGARGCYVKSGQEAFWAPAERCGECVDTTGAGDSFVGGFLYGLAQGWTVGQCAANANRCGAKAVEQLGAVTWIAP